MLDVQRYKGAVFRHEVEFARRVIWGHLIFGAVVTAMFLFHEVFWWFGGSMVWYAASLIVMYGFMSQRKGCRVLLAVVFLCGAMAGLYFINCVFPLTQPPRGALMPHALMPAWVGLANLVYGSGTLLFLFSKKMRRAGSVGFTLQ